MLVLTRRESEEIVIDKNIRVKVLRIERSSVQLGIDAPPDIPIVRPDAKDKERKHETG